MDAFGVYQVSAPLSLSFSLCLSLCVEGDVLKMALALPRSSPPALAALWLSRPVGKAGSRGEAAAPRDDMTTVVVGVLFG